MNRCRRCGKVISPGKLWCVECRKKIDDELKGGVERPFEYYFRWWKKHGRDFPWRK